MKHFLPDTLSPHDLRAEQASLGACFRGGAPTVLAELSGSDYYQDAHRRILDAVAACVLRDEDVDPLTVAAELDRRGHLEGCGGFEYLVTLREASFSGSTAAHYCRPVVRASRFRTLLTLFAEYEETCREQDREPEAVADELACLLLNLGRETGKTEQRRLSDVTRQERERIERQEAQAALLTGLPALDAILEGLEDKEVGILCGHPGQGKTILVCQMLLHAAATWGPVLYVSLEMGGERVARRYLAGLTGLRFADLRMAGQWNPATNHREPFGPGELTRIREAEAALLQKGSEQVFIEEETGELTRLIARCHRARQRDGIRAIFVDYGQLVQDDSGRKRGTVEEMTYVARAMKRELAVPLKMPVWVACQPNQENEKDGKIKPLTAAQIGWSSEWRKVAGRIVLLNPSPETTAGEGRRLVNLEVAKNRDAGTGRITLALNGPRFRFEEVDETRDDIPPERHSKGSYG